MSATTSTSSTASLLCHLRQGQFHSNDDNKCPTNTFLQHLQQHQQKYSQSTSLTLLLDDSSADTLTSLKQCLSQSTLLLIARVFLVHSDGLKSAPPSASSLISIVPTAMILLTLPHDTTEQQLAAWCAKHKITPQTLTLRFDDVADAHITADRILALEKHANGWFASSSAQLMALSAASSSSYPIYLSHSFSSSSPLLEFDRLLASAPLLDLTRIQGLFLPINTDSDVFHLISQHWQAILKRQAYRAKKAIEREQQARGLMTVQHAAQYLPSPATTKATPSFASAAGASAVPSSFTTHLIASPVPSSSSVSHAHPVHAPLPSLFYRSSFQPSTMFYRVAIHWAPSSATSALLAHGLLTEALRSFLGGVGFAQCAFQLLEWDESTSHGIVTSDAGMSVGVRAAWMLIGSHQQKICRVEVKQQSVFLSALATK